MIINALYSKYFQKSKIFLYPLLDIKRGGPATPIETYFSWGSNYTSEDMKLICLYENRKDVEYLKFERDVLLKHSRLYDYVKIDDKSSVFVFDFSDLGSDWDFLVDGKYSRIRLNLKRSILDYFERRSGNYIYIHTYLFPEEWFKRYAELLGVTESLLIGVGELCDKPDLEKENLQIQVADLQNIKILD
jgi:hypothetical protein